MDPTRPPLRTAASPAPFVVLDTNVVLDWLVFRDPGCEALNAALVGGAVRWVGTAPMRDELERVLARGSLDAWNPDRHALVLGALAAWNRCAHVVPPPPPMARAPRCTDPDDQPFIDLALHLGASALLSRDRAVLRCARAARTLGLAILTPAAWAATR